MVCHAWRSTAIDHCLWQEHYWAFYRAPSLPQSEEDRLLCARREYGLKADMRAWIEQARVSAPPSHLGPLCSTTAAGHSTLYEPLAKGMLMLISMGVYSSFEQVAQRMVEVATEHYGSAGPQDADEAAERIISILGSKCANKVPEEKDFVFAEQHLPLLQSAGALTHRLLPSTASCPAFLDAKLNPVQSPGRLPPFHTLFVKRMSQDDRLLRDIDEHIKLGQGVWNNLLLVLERYGDSARDLLFALCSEQQLTRDSIGQLVCCFNAALDNSRKQNPPRALTVHVHAASSVPALCLPHCIKLQHTAYELLGHLQRREAVRTIRQLQDRRPPPASTRRGRVLDCCLGVEQALISLSLFHFGETSEISAYLDILALYVWAELDAVSRWDLFNPQAQADSEDPRATTTRIHLARIEAALRRLGFCIAGEEDENDLASSFVNVALFCPAHRATSSLVFGAILCGVCRRLGVAAALVNAPGWIVVVEDVKKPQDWEGPDRDWDHFYFMPHNTRRRHEIEPASKVAQMVAGATADQRVGYSAEEFLEPASPLTIAKSIAAPISHALRRNVGPTVDGSITTMSPSSSGVKSSEPISLLRDYLLGRKASPPLPLPSVALSSSLAMLPPTRAGFPRVNSLAVRQDARYLTLWLLRLVAPETIGGVRRAEELIVDEVTDCAYLRSDIALLLEVNSCHVQTQIGLARQFWGRAGDGNQKAESLGDFNFEYVDGPDPPEAVQALLRCAFKYDGEPHDGLGGYGGGEPGGPRVQELLDSAHPRNAAVRHGVGTVFTHRQEGYRAVAFGWDNVRKSVDDEIPTVRGEPRASRHCTNLVLADPPSPPNHPLAGPQAPGWASTAVLLRVCRRRISHIRSSKQHRGCSRVCWVYGGRSRCAAWRVLAAL